MSAAGEESTSGEGTVLPLRAAGRPQRARAYCGDAHHQECIVSGDHPPQYLDLPVPTGTRRYRLVRDPRTGAPAHDPGGALVFVPAREREVGTPEDP